MVGLLDKVGDWLGNASTLRRFLGVRAPLNVALSAGGDSIWMRSVIRWDRLNECQENFPFVHSRGASRLKKWEKDRSGVYRLELVDFPLFDQLSKEGVFLNWTCDLRALHGLSASKSSDVAYASMEDMVRARRPELVRHVSEDALRALLTVAEFKVSSRPGPECGDAFHMFLWDGRIWLDNDDASHRMSAAKLMAKQLGIAAPLRSKLRTHQIDLVAVTTICAQYDWLAVDFAGDAFGAHFFDALKSSGCVFLQHRLPSAYPDGMGLLFPRSHDGNAHVVSILRDAGASDLGGFMRDLAAKSLRNASAPSCPCCGGSVPYDQWVPEGDVHARCPRCKSVSSADSVFLSHLTYA